MSSNLAISLVIGASVGGAITAIRGLTNEIGILRNNELSTTAKFGALGKGVLKGLSGVASMTSLVGSSVIGLAQPAIAFESAMADVKKVVDFKTPDGFKKLSRDILELTRTLPMSAEELAAITASGGQLGVAEKDLKDFTTTIAKMSVAFDMSAEDSGDAMAKLANVYKIPIKDIGNLGDAINELSNSSPAKASDIVKTLGRIGGVAKQFGLTENAAAALSNSFISLGKAPEVAGTAINGMLTKLMTADKGGKKFQAALKSMGLNAKDLKKAIGQDAQGALTSFLKQIQKLPKEKQMGALVDLFGLEYADDVAVLAGNVDVLENSLRTLQETDENGKAKYLDSMEKEFAARAATTENNLQLLKNSFTELGITIGAKFLPVINNVVNDLKPLIYGVTDWIGQNQETVNQLLMIGAGLATASVGFFALKTALSAVMFVGFGAYKTFATFFKITWALTRITAFLSIRLFDLGISFAKLFIKINMGIMKGFIAALKLTFSATFALGKILGGMFLKAIMGVGKAFLFMGRAMLASPIGTLIAIGTVALLVWQYWEPIKKFFATLWEPIKPYFDGFVQFVGGMWNGIVGFWSAVWDGVVNWFTGLWESIKSLFSGNFSSIGSIILNFNPLSLFVHIFSSVLNWFGIDLPSKFTDFGKNMIDGLVNGIKNAWEGAKQIVSDLGDGIKGWFAEKLGIHSPSRVFKGYGVNVVEGLAIGMNKAQPLAEKASAGLSEAVNFDGTTQGNLLANYQPLNRNAVANSETIQGGIVVHFSPNITLTGNAPQSVTDQLQSALKMGAYEFEQLLNRVLDQRQRRAY
ncbi:phage tail tape measure protein [Gallibacterium anatis]|uniref:phage tail tape measure protein n=1 Tax=Gallibacterium anatis TaxID=750 RepID=UPI00254BA325|nr:phage tail tape measure protein [Gallibacterium anatis]WIM82581.1 phage tail tape measure protein [Gallibacterium anatis]